MLTITLSDTGAEIRTTQNGKTVTKLVDLADIPGIFKENTEYDSGDLGLIGDGAMGIKRVISRGNKHCVLVHAINPCIDVSFYGVTKKLPKVWHPSLIMSVNLVQQAPGRYIVDTQNTCLLAAKNILLTPDDQLYFFPFSNVYEDGMGKICWGSNRLPELNSFAQAIGILQLFLYATANYDLYRRLVVKKGSPYDQGAGYADDVFNLMKAISGEKKLESFPYDEITLRPKVSYKDFVQYCRGRL